jgi:hypothetical protein
MGFEDRYPAIKLPQLDIVSVDQLPGAIFCRLLVGTIKIGRAYSVATFIQKVNSIVQHSHGPKRGILFHDATQDHGNLVVVLGNVSRLA